MKQAERNHAHTVSAHAVWAAASCCVGYMDVIDQYRGGTSQLLAIRGTTTVAAVGCISLRGCSYDYV